MKNRIWSGVAIGVLLGSGSARAEEQPAIPAGNGAPARGEAGGHFHRFTEEVKGCPRCAEFGLCAHHAEILRKIRERLRDAPPEVRERAREWAIRHERGIRERVTKRFDADQDGSLNETERKQARETIEARHPGLFRPDRREDVRDRREDYRDRREDVRDQREDVRDAQHDGGRRDRIEDRLDAREDVWDEREDKADRREDVWDGGHGGDPYGFLRDRREDVRDRREDVRDRRENVRDRRR